MTAIHSPAPLVARGLALSRGGRRVVEDVDIELAPGAAAIIEGPNGAGKTTLLRALAGLIQPDAGAIEGPPREARIFLGVDNGAKPALTVRENLRFWRALYGARETRIEEAIDRFALAAFADRPLGALSTGYRRRVGLARLIIADRAFWFVDEPISGLDADAAAIFTDMLTAALARGASALIAAHGGVAIDGAARLRLAA